MGCTSNVKRSTVQILLVSLMTTNLPFVTLQQSSYVRYPKNGFLPVQKKERRKLLLGLCVHAARCEDNVAVHFASIMWRVADVGQPAWCSALSRLYLQHQKPCRWGVENSLVIVRSIDQWSHQDGPQETLSVLSLNTFWINKRHIFWTEKTSPPKKPGCPQTSCRIGSMDALQRRRRCDPRHGQGDGRVRWTCRSCRSCRSYRTRKHIEAWCGLVLKTTIPESCGCDFFNLLSFEKNILLDAALSKDMKSSSKCTMCFFLQNPLILLSIFRLRLTSLAHRWRTGFLVTSAHQEAAEKHDLEHEGFHPKLLGGNCVDVLRRKHWQWCGSKKFLLRSSLISFKTEFFPLQRGPFCGQPFDLKRILCSYWKDHTDVILNIAELKQPWSDQVVVCSEENPWKFQWLEWLLSFSFFGGGFCQFSERLLLVSGGKCLQQHGRSMVFGGKEDLAQLPASLGPLKLRKSENW